MAKLCEGKVAVVTGAGRGIGKEHALMLAHHGAAVIVNDLGGDEHGAGTDITPAQEVVDEIRAAGGRAEVNGADVGDFGQAEAMIRQAIDTYGNIDILINNAGILRDRMIFSLSEDDFDAVIKVHLKGTFAPLHHAAVFWRERAKAGEMNDARVINTASPSGIYGNIGQTNYGAAKAGIAAMSIISAMELVKYGVTVNCLAPGALTRLTAPLMGSTFDEDSTLAMSPIWVAATAVWLCSDEAKGVTGRVFDVSGNSLSVAEGWRRGPQAITEDPDPATLGPVMMDLLRKARLNADMSGHEAEGPGRPTHNL